MSEELLVKQCAPTLAGIKTGSLFPCPCDDRESLLADIRRLNRLLVPKGLCLLPIRYRDVTRCCICTVRRSCGGIWKAAWPGTFCKKQATAATDASGAWPG